MSIPVSSSFGRQISTERRIFILREYYENSYLKIFLFAFQVKKMSNTLNAKIV